MGTKFEDLEKNSAKKLTGIGVVVFLHILVGPGTHGWYGKRHY